MSNEPSDDTSNIVKNAVVMAFLGLFSWHLYTLHNIAASVEVLIERVSMSNSRIERLEKGRGSGAVDYRTMLTSLGARAITFFGVAPFNSATIAG